MFKLMLPVGMFCIFISFWALNPLDPSKFGLYSDEGYYCAYAQKINQSGVGGFRDLIDWQYSHMEARKHPAVARVAYIGILAILFNVLGPGFSTVVLFSMFSFLGLLVLNYVKIKRCFSLEMAVLTTLLLASSPLWMGLSRRALIDMPTNLLWAGMFWSFFEYLERGRRNDLILFIALSIVALLFKEATILMLSVFLLITVLVGPFTGRKIPAKEIVLSFLMIGVGAAALLMLFLGGWEGLWRSLSVSMSSHTVNVEYNRYLIHFCSGPWYRYLVDFFLLSPLTVLLTTGYVFYFMIKKEKDWREGYFLAFLVMTYVIFSLFPHSKVVRYVSILEIAFAFFTVKAAALLWKEMGEGMKIFSAAGIVCLISILNFGTFIRVFYKPGLLDPITYHLVVLLGFMPA